MADSGRTIFGAGGGGLSRSVTPQLLGPFRINYDDTDVVDAPDNGRVMVSLPAGAIILNIWGEIVEPWVCADLLAASVFISAVTAADVSDGIVYFPLADQFAPSHIRKPFYISDQQALPTKTAEPVDITVAVWNAVDLTAGVADVHILVIQPDTA